MTRVLLSVLLLLVVCAQTGRAYDYEAGRLSERALRGNSSRGESYVPRAILGARSESLYQGSRDASIRAIRQVFGARAPAAIRVAACETGNTFYARSVGNAGERGIFQLHPIHRGWIDRLYGWNRMFEPVQNARAAYRLSRGGTRWGAWSCRWAA